MMMLAPGLTELRLALEMCWTLATNNHARVPDELKCSTPA